MLSRWVWETKFALICTNMLMSWNGLSACSGRVMERVKSMQKERHLNCNDDEEYREHCAWWANKGHCITNAPFMMYACSASCNVCHYPMQEHVELQVQISYIPNATNAKQVLIVRLLKVVDKCLILNGCDCCIFFLARQDECRLCPKLLICNCIRALSLQSQLSVCVFYLRQPCGVK